MTLGRYRFAGLCAVAILVTSAGLPRPRSRHPPPRGSSRSPSGTAAARRARPCSSATRAPRRKSGARTSGRSSRSASTRCAPGSTGPSGEPARASTTSRTLDVLLELAEEEGLKLFLQVYMDSAPHVGRRAITPIPIRFLERRRRFIPSLPPATAATTRACAGRHRLLRRARQPRPPQPRLPRMGPLERAARHQLGQPDLDFEPRVLLLPAHHSAASVAGSRRSTADSRNSTRRGTGGSATWDQVEPSRMSTILSYTDYIDWKTFIADKLGEDLARPLPRRQDGRAGDDRHQPCRGGGPLRVPHHWEGQADDWTMAAAGRLLRHVLLSQALGVCRSGRRLARGPARLHALVRLRRGAGGFWVGELQGGFGTIALNVSPTVTLGRSAHLDVDGAVARRQGHQLLRVVPDELRLRSRADSGSTSSTAPSRTAPSWPARLRSVVDRAPVAVPRRPAAARRGGGRLQPAGALRRRPPARRGLRRAAGRGRRHRARLAARRTSRAVRRATCRSTTCTSIISRPRRSRPYKLVHPSLSADAARGVRARP